MKEVYPIRIFIIAVIFIFIGFSLGTASLLKAADNTQKEVLLQKYQSARSD